MPTTALVGTPDRAVSRLRPMAPAGIVMGLLLWYVAPWPFATLGAILFVGSAALRLDLALLTVVLVCPFYRPVEANPLPAKPIGDQVFSLVEFAILGCAVAWILRAAAGVRPRLPETRAWLPVAAFVGASAVAGALAAERQVAFRELRVVIVEPALYGLMLLTTLDDRGVRRLIWSFVVLGAAAGLYAIYHYLVINIVEATGGVRRVLAIYHSPNQLALLLDRLVPIAAVLALPAMGDDRRAWARRALPALAALVPMGIALAITYSRGAWIAVAVAVLAAALFRGWRVFVPALFLAGGASAVALTRINPARLMSDDSSLSRLPLWESAIRMIRDHPLAGIGPDNFLTNYRNPVYMPADGWKEPDVSHPHNLVLDAWLRTGVLGLAALVAAIAIFWLATWRVLRGPSATWGLAIAAAMLASLVHSLFDNGLFLIDLAVLFWALFAAMLILARRPEQV